MTHVLAGAGVLALALSAPAAPSDPASVARVEAAELEAAIENGHAIAVDVRGAEVYRAGHIPGALLLPNGSGVGERAAQLARSGKTVVTYCT